MKNPKKYQERIIFLPKPHVYPHHSHPHLTVAQTLSCGIVAGVVTRTAVAPLDVVKIVLQLHGINAYCTARTISGTLHHIYLNEGLRGYWKGNAAGCARLAPYAATKFCLYDTCKAWSKKESDDDDMPLDPFLSFMYGALSGMTATMVSYPMELLRMKRIVTLSVPGKTSPGIRSSLSTMYTKEGLQGCYRGSGSALAGVGPFEGIQFTCYEGLKIKAATTRWPNWRWPQEKESLNSLVYLVLGAFSGLVAQTATYPLDSIKKRLQAQGPPNPVLYTGMVDCAHQVIKNEGITALYRGTFANMIRILPYSALMFTTYESLKAFLLPLEI